jgi:tryptophan synthase beta chain
LLGDREVVLIGVEAGGTGDGLGQNAATLATGTPGVLQGSYSLILQDDDGQVQETHSISAGLDYSGVGPEHAFLQAVGRVTYITASDDEALAALEELCAAEGILTALETAHAYAAAKRWSKQNRGKRVLICNSGRGDKDMPTLTREPAKTVAHAAA